MTHSLTTTIEIDEVETEVKIEFEMMFGEAEIDTITDVQTGCAITPDKDGSMTKTAVDSLYDELREWAQGVEQILLENEYHNI
jgi:hypothetical protein